MSKEKEKNLILWSPVGEITKDGDNVVANTKFTGIEKQIKDGKKVIGISFGSGKAGLIFNTKEEDESTKIIESILSKKESKLESFTSIDEVTDPNKREVLNKIAEIFLGKKKGFVLEGQHIKDTEWSGSAKITECSKSEIIRNVMQLLDLGNKDLMLLLLEQELKSRGNSLSGV